MSANLRKLPALKATVDEIVGGHRRDAFIVDILEQFWPDCYQSEHTGAVIIAPADAVRLEALFELFGVPLKVSDNRLPLLAYAYDVFSIGLGPTVSNQLRFPAKLELFHPGWPLDWLEYIRAIAARGTHVRMLAHRLQVLSPDCEFPAGIYVPSRPKPPLGNAEPDKPE